MDQMSTLTDKGLSFTESSMKTGRPMPLSENGWTTELFIFIQNSRPIRCLDGLHWWPQIWRCLRQCRDQGWRLPRGQFAGWWLYREEIEQKIHVMFCLGIWQYTLHGCLIIDPDTESVLFVTWQLKLNIADQRNVKQPPNPRGGSQMKIVVDGHRLLRNNKFIF